MNKCEKCGFLHYRTDPCRKLPKKSEVAGHALGGHRAINAATEFESPPTSVKGLASPAKVRDAETANTKDANNFAESPNGRAADFESGSAGSTPASAPKFDKKAWMREYMREHRRGIRRRAAK